MTPRPFLALLVTAALAGGCGVLPGGGASQQTAAGEVRIGTAPAPRGSEQVGRYTENVRSTCASALAERAAFDRALAGLRERAAADGVSYLRVLGTGELEERGRCDEDFFRLSGIGYRDAPEAAGPPARDGGSGGTGAVTAPPDRAGALTERLQELETLRERGLISAEEYRELRERVLDQAY